MNQINSESELLQAFRPRDRKHVELPKRMSFPIALGHYFTWAEPSGVYRYIVFKKPNADKPVGMVFKRCHAGSHESKTRLCNWCHAYGPSDQIGLLTVSPSSKRTVGTLLCLDLSCILKLETIANLSKKNFDQMAEQMREKMIEFYDKTFESEAP